MTQEDKELLLKDLCCRLLYGVKCGNTLNHRIGTLTQVSKTEIITLDISNYDECFSVDICRIKPYLRPMSSMTNEEDKEWQLYKNNITCACNKNLNEKITELYNWFNKNYFDYRGLIDKGLAIEAPKGMYN